MRYEMKTITDTKAYDRPDLNGNYIGWYSKGSTVVVNKLESGWYRVEGNMHWISAKYLEFIKNLNPDDDPALIVDSTQLDEYEQEMVRELYAGDSYNGKESHIDNMRYLFGAPMQYNKAADPRLDDSKLGRLYLQNMVSDMSLLTITPGKAEFMKYFKKENVKNVGYALLNSNDDQYDESLTNILTGNEKGRYYSFTSDYVEYIKYVNGLCNTAAVLLGIGDKCMYDGSAKYQDFDWDINNLNKEQSTMFSFLTTEKSVSFVIDGKQSNFSDGMNNSTSESKIAGLAGTGSDLAKEAKFLFGTALDTDSLIDTSQQNYEAAVSKVFSSLTNNDSIISRLGSQLSDAASSIIHGGNVCFPEIWRDSTYNKSYDINFKFISPYGDKESIYLYVLVPLFHIMAFSFPRQLGSNSYLNPFLIRAYCKSWFNCPLGLVDNVSIKRASDGDWSVDGLPTSVEVTMSIRDLYQNLALSRSGDFSAYNNIEYMDMISTWCGVNMNVPELSRKLKLYSLIAKHKFTRLPGNLIGDLNQTITNKMKGFLGGR